MAESLEMEKVLKNVVSMVKQHPSGIPLKKLAIFYSKTYHSNLTLSKLGFDSMTSLVASLDGALFLVGQLVFHRDHHAEFSKNNETVLKNIVAFTKEHPDGIEMKNLATAYWHKYHQCLTLAPLGFKKISSLVESLNEDLVVSGDMVFHKIYKLQSPAQAAATPNTPEPLLRNGSPAPLSVPQRTASPQPAPLAEKKKISMGPPSSTHLTASRPAEELTQEQLYQRILEVTRMYQLSAPSMDQLQVCYFQQFGEPLPLSRYMSLYDSLNAKTLLSQPQPMPVLTTVVRQTPSVPQNSMRVSEKQQELPNGLSVHSSADFPELGAVRSSTRVTPSPVRDTGQRESDAPVFREAYHAQQREVLGCNIRAVEAMEEDEEYVGRRRSRAMDQETLNSLMEGVRREIAAEGELVTREKVISRVCRLNPSLDPEWIKHSHLPALKDLQYLMREINMFIETTEMASSICTLYELGQSLAGLKDKKRYEELNLGPLCKLPLVHRIFKIDSSTKDDDIFQIETVDILKQLRVFRRKNPKIKVDLAEFLKHMADHYLCNSPYELGIRISSVGLPISTLMKVSRSEHAILDRAREVIQKELEEETYERLRKLKKNVLEQGSAAFSSGANMELRKKYASMPASEVVLAVFTNADQVFSPSMAKHVQNFLLQVSCNRLATALFQLAICGGSLAVPQDLVPKNKTAKTPEQVKTEEKASTSLPSEAKVKQYLKEKLASQNSVITLAHMASLEKKLTEHFSVKDFLSLELGSFLEFLVKHIQLLRDSAGSTLILGTNSMDLSGTGFRPTRQDVFEFIKQCGDIASTDPDDLAYMEVALRSHYRVRDSRDLGLGTLTMLAGMVQRQKALAGGGLSQVYYESALLAKHGQSSAEGGLESVGCLGEMSKEQALAGLLSCPLLEDLREWSQWELIFKPRHGAIKDFIERNAADTGLAALEVMPGVLLRITTNTGDKHFSSAADALDPVATAGHLVSVVVADGLANAPTALLANHMQSALAAAVAKEDLSQADEDASCYGTAATFLLSCLTRIPARTCQALLQQVFLEPFSRVLGQARSKQVLMAVAQSDPRHMNCLHRLGILLGITDWVRDYQKKLNPPEQHNHNTCSAHVDQTKGNTTDSECSSLSAFNMSEDEYLDENIVENSFVPSQLQQSLHEESMEQDVEVEADDDEELYELASHHRELSDVSSEAEGSEVQLITSDTDEKEAIDQSGVTSAQRAVIEDIRKSEFGIGVELNSEGQKLMQVHQERLGRSLDRLSTELYSKDTHFVLELIQNADDNSYPSERGVVPALAFVVERDCITVLNNETGFQEKNIRAVCDVGRSTKGKHKYGYIGQKGIGFKSVFKVTDRPEIHSNGFHLRFDKNCGPMGYILPHWTQDERPLDAQLKDRSQHSWTTKISLPLRSESHQTRNLFHDVHPSLLLFLHRLRSITIYNQSEQHCVTMTRKDLSHNMLEVEHTEGTERWLVVKTTLQPKKEVKEDIESTELALAFQLSSDTPGGDVICQPQKQPVFAYLPLRSFGFRFIVQADFDIPSSREDVDRDSSWNQWLRSEIPHLFLQAMDVFTDHPEFRGLKGLCQFLQFIPLPDEVLDFFKPVAGHIIQLLKGKAFLPTLSSDGQIVHRLPSQVAVCQDAVIRDVIGGDELERHLSLSYLHPGLSPAPPASLLTHLGVRYLQGTDVSTVTTAMAKELIKMDGIHSDGGLRRLAKLLVCNFRALEHGYGDADSVLQTLGDLPIIPLADGRVVALNGEAVFFPMEESKAKKKKAHRAHTGALSALYKDVSVVHPSLLSCLDPLETQQVRELLRRLGVHELEPQQLLDEHIYPLIRSSRWKSKPESVVVSYLVFIKQHSSSSRDYSDLQMPVLTSRGLLCPTSERVHFSDEYGNINLPQKLPGYDWILLSPCYVQTDDDVAGWRELFFRLGVRDGLIVRKEKRTLTSTELASSPWCTESTAWRQDPGADCVLDDYACEEFHALATAQLPGSLLLQQRTALLELLETNWDTGHGYSRYLTAEVTDGDRRPTGRARSSFYHHLCGLEWLPAYRPLKAGQQERKFLRPSSVYLRLPEVTDVLGTHVDYADVGSSEFSRALGMRETISVDVLIKYLKEWCVKPRDDEDQTLPEDQSEGAEFTSTVEHVHNVYRYLDDSCPQSSLKELFQHTPAVFVADSRPHDGWCSGRFYHLKEVCWTDATAMFQRYRDFARRAGSPLQEPRFLAPFYRDLDGMKGFFLRLLNVHEGPNMKQYVGLLELICSSCAIPTAEVLQDVSLLYATLAQKCKVQGCGEQENVHQRGLNSAYCSTLKGMVSDMKVFPTKDSWVCLSRKPMIGDSRELEKIFKPHQQVCLLNLPPAKKTRNFGERVTFSEEDRRLFLEICGVRLLSDCVKSEPLTENLRPCPSMQAMVCWVVPYIQRFLYHHDELSEVYVKLKEDGIAEKIKRLSFGQVGKLYIRYQLDVGEDPVIELQDVICLLKDEKELYIQKDHLSEDLDICRELVKLFCAEIGHRKELMQFLSSLITLRSDQRALNRFLTKEDVRDLPSDEEQWEVPEPPKREILLERVLSGSRSAVGPPEETPRPAADGGEDALTCWPPRAPPMNAAGGRGAHADSGAVEAVMKMWPPPAAPKERAPEQDGAPRGDHRGNQPHRSGDGKPAEHLPPQRALSHPEPGRPNATAAAAASAAAGPSNNLHPPERSQHGETTQSNEAEGGERSPTAPRPTPSPPSAPPAQAASERPAPSSLAAPEAVIPSSTFQGTAGDTETHRPLLNFDVPLWNKDQAPQETLEDMKLTCQIPTTVVLSDDPVDMRAIGEWGEQLVNSFLCHWRDGDDPARPTHVLWANQSGETGQPYDFRLSYGPEGSLGVVFVEVKSTVKRERSFIHLSANELDFALKEKERYHVYRVYSAGDAHNVRLCRIQNLAQHLHTKDLALYLFV